MDRDAASGLRAALLAYTLWGLLTLYWKQLSGLDAVEMIGWRVGTAAMLMVAIVVRHGSPSNGRRRASGALDRAQHRRSRRVAHGELDHVCVGRRQRSRARDGARLLPRPARIDDARGDGARRTTHPAQAGIDRVRRRSGRDRDRLVRPDAVGGRAARRHLVVVRPHEAPRAARPDRESDRGGGGPRAAGDRVGRVRVSSATAAYPIRRRAPTGSGSSAPVRSPRPPLLLFAYAAKRLPLTVLGPTNYLVPIINFLLGWLVFDEALTPSRVLGFGLVWVALALVTIDRGPARVARSVATG